MNMLVGTTAERVHMRRAAARGQQVLVFLHKRRVFSARCSSSR